MATGAGLAEWEQTHGKKKAKCVLTSTGLLMEGLGGFHYMKSTSPVTALIKHWTLVASVRVTL